MPRGRTQLESDFQEWLLNYLRDTYPGVFILKGNSSVQNAIPDWLIFYGPRWAMLEVKASATARKRPNQDYYVDNFNDMSFAAFIYPENKEEVLHDLHLHFTSRNSGAARLPKR